MKTYSAYMTALAKRKESAPGKPMTFFEQHAQNAKDPQYQARLAKADLERTAAAQKYIDDANDFKQPFHQHALDLIAAAKREGKTIQQVRIEHAQHVNHWAPI